MEIDTLQIALRNIFLLAFGSVLMAGSSAPLFQEQLLRIWKSLKAPLVSRRERKTNHKSNKFWVIDMTDFEP